jgi:hypothetical protein
MPGKTCTGAGLHGGGARQAALLQPAPGRAAGVRVVAHTRRETILARAPARLSEAGRARSSGQPTGASARDKKVAWINQLARFNPVETI